MIARGLLLAALVVAVCSCASMAPERTSMPNTFYMVGDNAPRAKANAAPGSMQSEGEFSVVKRIYWFFAGR